MLRNTPGSADLNETCYHGSQCLGRDMSLGPPKYKPGVLTT
jgi:hypothetical protein